MPLAKTRVKMVGTGSNMAAIIRANPEKMFGVKASKIYAQIAKTGRNPRKQETRATLIAALDSVSIKPTSVKVRKASQYVPMSGKDISLCFGKEVASMPSSSFVKIED